jgi:hypothetical protein
MRLAFSNDLIVVHLAMAGFPVIRQQVPTTNERSPPVRAQHRRHTPSRSSMTWTRPQPYLARVSQIFLIYFVTAA